MRRLFAVCLVAAALGGLGVQPADARPRDQEEQREDRREHRLPLVDGLVRGGRQARGDEDDGRREHPPAERFERERRDAREGAPQERREYRLPIDSFDRGGRYSREDDDNDRYERPRPRDGSGDAARRAQQMNGGGRVLAVDPVSGGHRVKLLRNGEVRIVFVPD